jgi:hypothetical protein
MRLSKDAQKALASTMDRLTLADAREWLLKTHKLRMSPSALSRFYSWFHVSRTIEESRDIAAQLGRELKGGGAALSDDRINQVTQRAFELLALRKQDSKLFFAMRRLRQKDAEITLDQQRFQRETCALFLKWSADKRATEIAEGAGKNSEKIDKLRQLMFADLETPS